MTDRAAQPIAIGQIASWSHTVTADDIENFAALSGDTNPVHLDQAYAANTRFKGRVAHGVLTVGYISNVVGTKLVGPDTTAIYLEQSARFLKPVRIGDRVNFTVEVTDYNAEKRRATLATTASGEDGAAIMTGSATVLLDPYPFSPPS